MKRQNKEEEIKAPVDSFALILAIVYAQSDKRQKETEK
jgi:hypothetical protein